MFSITNLAPQDLSVTAAASDFIEDWQSAAREIVAHTSGSTGKPKEIHLPKSDMEVSAAATIRRFGLTSASRMLCPLSISYIAGKMMIVRAMIADCQLALCRPSNDFWFRPETEAYLSSGSPIDLLPVVPSQCVTLLDRTTSELPAYLSNIRNVIIGGAPLHPDTERQLLDIARQTGISFYATYGMTETCSHVALRPLGTTRFNAMPDITFSTDNRGCLTIDAAAYSFRQLQTNDIVTLHDTRHMTWLGRFDNVINSGGLKIFPEELERKLAPHIPCRFYIKGTPDPKWGETVTLVIETASGCPTDDALLSACGSVLNSHEMPKTIIHMEHIPTTANGKLLRH